MLTKKSKLNIDFNDIASQKNEFNNYIPAKSLEERVILLIIRDLIRLGWNVNFDKEIITVKPPEYYDKETIKKAMSYKRNELINKNRKWIDSHIELAKENLANGWDVWNSEIIPSLEICETKEQFDLFRIYRYYWSSPYSDYVGRRIKIIVRDIALPSKPVIGIIALGSSIIHIPERDQWIGWDKKTRTENLIYTMDAYVLGALPPYSYLLGGKLLSYLLASSELINIYKKKYADQTTIISSRKANDIACIFTTSLYGKSSQYNRIKYDDIKLYKLIGYTKGYGTLHLTDETFSAMSELLRENKILISNKFGDGPSWRMRVIRSAADILGFDSDFLLRHSFKRAIYLTPLATNYLEFLKGKEDKLKYYNFSLNELTEYWRNRWYLKRKNSENIKDLVLNFNKRNFNIL
jgi:hypothetical protein